MSLLLLLAPTSMGYCGKYRYMEENEWFRLVLVVYLVIKKLRVRATVGKRINAERKCCHSARL